MNIGIIYDEIFLKHYPGDWHPERPERLQAILRKLEAPEVAPLLTFLSPRKAEREEILWNHTEAHYERVASTAGQKHTQLDPDTGTSEHSFEAALYAVGAQFVGLDEIFRENFRYLFALVRPPGHHAEADRAMGFCLFNNVALAAHYALKVLKLSRVLIVDWDLHHGNGTQHSFYESPEVLYFSIHQFPYYPGTGRLEEIGRGEGEGYTVNIPLSAGCGDEEYITFFTQILKPVALKFKPEVLLISAGFDPYHEDPLGGMRVTAAGFGAMAAVLKDIAEEVEARGILFTLEGGYSLTGLAEGVAEVIQVLAGTRDPKLPEEYSSRTLKMVEEVRTFFSRWWDL